MLLPASPSRALPPIDTYSHSTTASSSGESPAEIAIPASSPA